MLGFAASQAPPPPSMHHGDPSSTAGVPPAPPQAPKQRKYAKINSVEQALRQGVPVISPFHAPRTQIWLKQTAAPNSQLSDVARRHLYCDYMFLVGQVAREKLEKSRRRGVQKLPGSMKYQSKKLQELYQCSNKTIQRIIKLGRTAESTNAKKRPGRTRAVTTADLSAANVLHQTHLMGGN